MTALQVYFLSFIIMVSGHGYIKDPIARTAIHRHPDFITEGPYVDDPAGQMCNGVQQDVNISSCGRCGEAQGIIDNNQGGIYDKGVIVAKYEAGTEIELTTVFEAGHYGHFEFELCPYKEETDHCFQKLPILSASEQIRDGNRVCVPFSSRPCGNLCPDTRSISAVVKLPDGVRCDRCTIRWNYRTSYPGSKAWDFCDNPNPAQVFRNCADVQIF